MDTNLQTPTFANILASLQVKGAASAGGPESAKRIPVLDDQGKLDVSFLPLDAISASVSIPPLARTAYVDPRAGEGIDGYVPDGSVMRPYPTLAQAAAAVDGDGNGIFDNFVLTPGSYAVGSTENVTFATSSSLIRIIGTGTVAFGNLSMYGYRSGTIVLVNVSTGEIKMNAHATANLFLLGRCDVNTVRGAVSDTDDPDVSESYLNVTIGPSVRVAEYRNVGLVGYFASTDTVGNVSIVLGKTTSDALNRLQGAKLEIPVFSAFDPLAPSDSSDSDSSDPDGIGLVWTEIERTVRPDAQTDVYRFRLLGESLVRAVNRTFYKQGDDLTVNDIFARTVAADSVIAEHMAVRRENGITLVGTVATGTQRLYIDSEDCLVVGEEDQ